MRNLYFALLTLIFCASCQQPKPEDTSLLQLVTTRGGYTLARINDPWQPAEVAMQYLLVPAADQSWTVRIEEQLRQDVGDFTLLRTPLQRMTVTTACHAWLLGQLDALDHVAVLCDTAYVMAEDIRQWMRNSHIADGGNSMSPNQEILFAANTDAVWISPYEGASITVSAPVIYCADYMETSPLRRAEWIRFYGRLVDKATMADSLYHVIATRYDSLVHISSQKPDLRRAVLAELPYGATWYVPGGKSTSALLYRDAGYDYPWSDDTHAGSLSLSPEAVLAKAAACDRWLFKYMSADHDWTLSEFLQQNPYYPQFHAAQTGEVWGCNTSRSDFFDVTPFRPDLLLESLIHNDGRFFQQLR